VKYLLLIALVACSSAPAREARPTPSSPQPPQPPDAGVVAVIAPPLDAAPECLDEVGCLLTDHDKVPACCAKYRGRGWNEHQPDPGPDPLPETLDSTHIKNGVANVKTKIMECGDRFPDVHGTVKLKVTVAPGGWVTNIDVKETPDTGLGDCAVYRMKQARFAKAVNESKFTYPFRF